MNKIKLRKYYLNQRKNFSEKEVQDMSHAILMNLKSMPIWEFSTYHLFQSIPNQNEVNTQEIKKHLFSLDKTVLVPKIEGNKMVSCEIDENTEWINGKFNVPEPKICQIKENSSIEVVFVPMLICDLKGNRIGYGGGFYDRFLENCRPDVLKIGLNFFPPISEITEVETFDIPLDYCVTPTEIVSFLD